MENVEIERKFLVHSIPFDIERFEHKTYIQGYLSTKPVVRVRKEGEDYVLTYKGVGDLVREEYNLPLDEESFLHLLDKADDNIIIKRRFFIPFEGLVIELDLFDGDLAPLRLAEIEFKSEQEAKEFVPPDWFGDEVTYDPNYSNASMSKNGLPPRPKTMVY